ncbi:MAG: hypothetical protein ABGX27_05895 [Desulfurobacteriaceae bacterium]
MAKKSSRCPKNPMTPEAAARIQSATARANGGITPKGSFAAKAQSAAAKNFGSNGKCKN